MRYKAYISVLGPEAVVRSLHEQAGITGSQIKQRTKVTAAVSPTGQAAPWDWTTPRTDIAERDPDKGLRELLNRHSGLGALISRVRNSHTYVSVVLIAQREESEAVRGLLLSLETMQRVVELGAHFEVDVVSLMAE